MDDDIDDRFSPFNIVEIKIHFLKFFSLRSKRTKYLVQHIC